MNPSPHQWYVPFACPACGKASRVTPSTMNSVLRCPHCRMRVVIGKDRIEEAPRGLLGLLARAAAAKALDERTSRGRCLNTRGKSPEATCGGPQRLKYIIATSIFAAVLVGAALIAVRWSGPRSLASLLATDLDARQLTSNAEAFQSALLTDDLELAQSFMLRSDAPALEKWWAPRRAALQAGFGKRFEGRVTAVEVKKRNGDQAVVRVLFTVKARQQQAFQDWQRTTAGWKLELTGTDSRRAHGTSASER